MDTDSATVAERRRRTAPVRRKQRSPWALDEERAELGQRIQGYARDHRCSYMQAFHAIELADRLGEP